MNINILIGRLTKELELRKTASGKSVISFTLAIARDKDNTDFVNCIAWDGNAENMCRYCSKGDMIAVNGRLQSRSYDAQDGTKRSVIEVVANKVTFLTTKEKTNNEKVEEDFNNYDLSKDGVETIISDDDLPF